jgi:prepilin-type N-terminal cleavage/methylation domain-containing protein
MLKCSKVGALSRGGFTLIEIVVALCIVAILTAIAIPGFKKATEDFRLNEFACNFDSLIKSTRAYYLIFNEWPPDPSRTNVPSGNIRYFLPSHLHKGNQLIYAPLRKSGTAFDFDNYIGSETMGIRARELGTYLQLAWGKLQLLGEHKNHFIREGNNILYQFLDIPPTNNENRYY